ncbi:MAG: hypothetical protein Q7O04_01950 [Candidatus Omnitrophota bacterium]|nr:hypothetical protein [Candidatus Omnitrophota bacterium]
MSIKRNYAKKTMIELSDEQYFFLKEKALELQKQNKNASIVSIIRDLIEKDREKWMSKRKKK